MEKSEDGRKEFQKAKGGNSGLKSLFSLNTNTIYAPTGVNSYYIRSRIYLDTTTEPVSGAMLQVLAADGETVLAYISDIDYYNIDYETGYYYIDYEYLTILQEITPGTYSIQLVAGEEKIPALTNIEFTGQPILNYVSLYNFYVGSDRCEVSVSMYNSSETQLEQLTFSLLDSNNDIVGQTSGAYRELQLDNNFISGYTLMNINGSISQGESYRLAITYTGEGTLCDGTGGIADYSYHPSSNLYPKITYFEVTDPMTSEVKVYVDYLETGSTYILTIRDYYYGRILHQSTVNGADSPFTVNLTLNGLTVPISVFNTWRFSVQIQLVGGYNSDSNYFINTYYNNADTINFDFEPFFINPNTTELPFTLRIYNAAAVTYHGDTDFKISVKKADGTELASITGDKTTIVHHGNQYEISGILNFSSLPNNTDLSIFFNSEKGDSAYVTDEFQAYRDYQMVDWSSGTFWLMMDRLYLKTDVINSSGTAKLVLKDENGTVVSESSVVAGTASKYFNHLTYEFTLTPQLENGYKYSLVLVDGEKEYESFSNFIYDGEFSFNHNNDLYLNIYDLTAGDTRIEGMIYAWDCKNMTSEYLSNFLKNIVLKDDDDNINTVTGYANGRFDYDGYHFDVMLSSPLSAGDYTITYPGGRRNYFTVIDPSVKTPVIYGVDAGEGFVNGMYLPTDAVYTAKIYQGYNCITNDPFTLTLSGEYTSNTVQYLYIPKYILSSLDAGSYELRIYLNGVLLRSVTLTISARPQQTVVAAYDPFNNSNVLLSTSGYVSFRVSNAIKYKQFRFSEDLDELSCMVYSKFLNAAYVLSPVDGEKNLYV